MIGPIPQAGVVPAHRSRPSGGRCGVSPTVLTPLRLENAYM